jgi:uncharacterized repeat protein (TIGR04076 family)
MDYQIIVKIVSIGGNCPKNFKIGDEVMIDDKGVHGDICIHALYSLLPKAFAMLYGVNFPWLEKKDVATHPCPDFGIPVLFELRRIEKKTKKTFK